MACLASILLLGPVAADTLGALRGATRQETLNHPQSVASYARSWGLAAEQIAWANGLSVEGKTGKKVTLPARILPADPPSDGAVVNLAERGVYVFDGGEYQGFFPIAIGRGDKAAYRTPTGSFKINDRQKNPTWVSPGSSWAKAMKSERISGDDADNPLGEYWFGFDHPKGGYGFHENTAPATTGDKVSHGCMRLYPEHAKKLYEKKLLVSGDTVRIENRPVVLGKGADGAVYVSLFPSAYGKVDLRAKLSQELEKEGLLDMVPAERLEALAAGPKGVPQPLLGKPVSLVVDGQPVKTETPAVRREGSVIVPVNLARELGCQVAYDGKAGLITVSKDGESQLFALEPEAGTPRAYRWGDQSMVPARTLFEALNIDFIWNAREGTLEVES